MDKQYNVQFIGDYFSMNVFVQGVEGDEETAMALASNIIKEHYGWDVEAVSNDVEVYEQD